MAGISTTLSVVDKMSGPINSIKNAMDSLIGKLHLADEATDDAFKPQRVDEATESIGKFSDSLSASDSAAQKLASTLKVVAVAAGAIAGIKLAANFAKEMVEASNAQIESETMLATVMNNMGASAEDYKSILQQASDLQSKSLYGDEAYIAGAAELATYVTDAEALKTVLNALPTFATGMSGGAELDAKGMTDIATQLGKVFNGAYDGIAKKGFVLTEQQKEIIQNGTDMEKALTISEIVNESWEGLAENMADTPVGAVTQLKNAWLDVKETIGMQLYPTVEKLANSLKNNLGNIQALMQGVGFLVNRLIEAGVGLAETAGKAGDYIMNNIDAVSVALAGISAVMFTVIDTIADILIPFANFFVNVWNSPLQSVGYLFVDFADGILNIIKLLATSIDEVFGSNLAKGVQGWRDTMYEYWEDKLGQRTLAIEPFELTESVKKGVEFGISLADTMASEIPKAFDATSLFDFSNTGLASDVNDIKENTSGIGTGATELVKYMRDIAERETINRLTTAEIKVELGGVTNNVSSDVDLDGFVNRLSEQLSEELGTVAAAYNGDF